MAIVSFEQYMRKQVAVDSLSDVSMPQLVRGISLYFRALQAELATNAQTKVPMPNEVVSSIKVGEGDAEREFTDPVEALAYQKELDKKKK